MGTNLSVMAAIVSDESIRSGRPRIDGTRITVLDVKQRVIDQGEDPHVVAGEYDVSMAELFTALAHFYEHRDRLEELERKTATARSEGERRTRTLVEGSDRSDVDPAERAD